MFKNWLSGTAENEPAERHTLGITAVLAGILVIVMILLSFYWDVEPDLLNVKEVAAAHQQQDGTEPATGSTTTATLLVTMETVLNKRGGYLSNDVMPPTVFMDNMPNWEYGVIVQSRDLAQAMRNDFSRSQTQSTEDPDLLTADPQFHYDTESWILPATESEYRKGIVALQKYLTRLEDPGQNAQFYARADNLRDWLAVVEKRLGSLSQRLSASVGEDRINTDLGGDAEASQSTAMPNERYVKTPWLEIDDIFYEARGSAWALVNFLQAVEIDFDNVLRKKNAVVSLKQIIRELSATQNTIWSPVVLNGTGFGIIANYSLIMSSYISRANAAVIDLRSLLEKG